METLTPYHVINRTQLFKPEKLIHMSISNRESEVLRLIAYEYTNLEIAKTLCISHHTVDSHRKSAMVKLKVKNTAGLIRRAFELGILQINKMARTDDSQAFSLTVSR